MDELFSTRRTLTTVVLLAALLALLSARAILAPPLEQVAPKVAALSGLGLNAESKMTPAGKYMIEVYKSGRQHRRLVEG